MHIKAKTLHNYYAKKLKIVQNQEKAFGVSLSFKTELYNEIKLLQGSNVTFFKLEI